MKRAIFKNYIAILVLALLLSGSIFSVSISKILLNETRKNMLNILEIIDQSLNYEGDIKSQIDKMTIVRKSDKVRFTLMDTSGKVILDSQADYTSMENHINRDEVRKALKDGFAYARRKSDTLKMSMLYVSYLSAQGDYILRLSNPSSGLIDHIVIILPAILLSLGISLIVSIILASRFSKSITKPLYEISEELYKLKDQEAEFTFKKYKYNELNLIAETTKKMADIVNESIKNINFEKLIRQEFFANASHELKTPITSIKGYIELIENGMATDEKMQKEFMARIKKESQNMAALINDILMVSRLETKEAEVVITDIRICPLINELIASLKPLAAEYDVSIEMSCKPIVIKANYGHMKELFNNLITNAIKYNKPKGTIKINVTVEGNDALFVIEDTGVGISEESRPRIFERFYRVDKGRSKKMGGTGLGLSIVKHIVNYYGGSIKLESTLGVGSKFTVKLPIVN